MDWVFIPDSNESVYLNTSAARLVISQVWELPSQGTAPPVGPSVVSNANSGLIILALKLAFPPAFNYLFCSFSVQILSILPGPDNISYSDILAGIKDMAVLTHTHPIHSSIMPSLVYLIGVIVLMHRLSSVTPSLTRTHTCAHSSTFSSSCRPGLPAQEKGGGRLEGHFTVYQAKERCRIPRIPNTRAPPLLASPL